MSAIGPKRTFLAALHMSAFGGKADMTFTGRPVSRSLLGVKRTWAGAVQMSAVDPKRTFVALFSVVGRLDNMACSEPRGNDEAARVHHAYRRRGRFMAARGACAAAG